MKYSIGAMAVLAGLAAATVTAAGFEPYLPSSPKVFKRVDADKNGKVSLSELQPLAERRFQKFDADKSGDVTAAEIDAALQKAMELRRNRMLKSMDADSSGNITKAELDQAVAALLKAADADSDGGVTLVEARKFKVTKVKKAATGETAN